MLRTPVPASDLDAPSVVSAYKNLKYAGVESQSTTVRAFGPSRASAVGGVREKGDAGLRH